MTTVSARNSMFGASSNGIAAFEVKYTMEGFQTNWSKVANFVSVVGDCFPLATDALNATLVA
jgi:hypothetical protein